MAKAKEKYFTDLVAAIEDETSTESITKRKGTAQRIRDCSESLELFAKTYFPSVFSSEFSPLQQRNLRIGRRYNSKA